jgi:hypothetical protein
VVRALSWWYQWQWCCQHPAQQLAGLLSHRRDVNHGQKCGGLLDLVFQRLLHGRLNGELAGQFFNFHAVQARQLLQALKAKRVLFHRVLCSISNWSGCLPVRYRPAHAGGSLCGCLPDSASPVRKGGLLSCREVSSSDRRLSCSDRIFGAFAQVLLLSGDQLHGLMHIRETRIIGLLFLVNSAVTRAKRDGFSSWLLPVRSAFQLQR